MYYFAKILLVWLLCLLSVLLHELGHAAGYRISGGKAGWKVIAGSGPKMISTPKYVFRLIPVGGLYFVPGEETRSNKEKIIMFAGGPLVSLMLTVLFGIIRFCIFRFAQPESSLYEILFPSSRFLLFFNFFQFLFTAIPMRYRVVCRGFESDGLQIVHALKHKKS
ncbi:MAG: site-2 protease family protein [Clostridiales bacterium]|nr:site-2 protease family protein [Clostridiales bacterium]